MSRPVADLLRLHAILAQCEMALVRRDAVVVALLAQATRHADGLAGARLVDQAAVLARAVDLAGATPPQRAARKVTQALCRSALHMTEAALWGAASGDTDS
ncbi:MAG TPA: hypothetical protein PKE32_08295 [Miltoncostaeaceae bacterium]|nr:hypothetical protein [Miltoncostaeaceae bacterium]